MAEMMEFEVLSSASNAVVARSPDRSFPGVLIQGDSLRILLDEAEELASELDAGHLNAARGIADVIRQRLTDFLVHYENVLDREGRELPYATRVRGTG